MRRIIVTTALAAALAIPMLAAPGKASATCSERKLTGTVLGGVGGALIGNSIARGGAGAVLGGLGGAVIGHEVAASGGGCRSTSTRTAYRYRDRAAPAPPASAARYVYYDQYGQPIASGSLPGATATTYAAAAACHTETRSFYDDRGLLVARPVQICDR
jgi:hypothetical protein